MDNFPQRLQDKDGKPVPKENEPVAECLSCHHREPVSQFMGDEPEDDKCPVCPCKHWEFV